MGTGPDPEPPGLAWLREHGSTIGEGRESAWQVVMLGFTVAEVAVLAATGTRLTTLVWVAAGVATASTLLMVTTPRGAPSTVPRSIAAAMGNVLVFGLLLEPLPMLGTGAMVVFALVYLGRLRPMRGVAYAAVAVPVCYLGPPLLAGRTDLLQPTALALVGLFMSIVVAGISWVWARDRADLEYQQSVVNTLVQTVDVGLVLMGEDGRYRLVNRRHEDFIALAYPGGFRGAPGSTDGRVYAADRTTPLAEELRPSTRAAAGEEFSGQIIVAGVPGAVEQRALAVSARPVLDDDGNWRGAVLAYHDITPAMRALDAKDDFVAMISHELRTPLTSIMGYLEMAQETPGVPAAALSHLAVVERSTERMLGLVTDLLHTAGADDGSLEIVLRPVLLHCVVEEAVSSLRSYADRSGIEIRLELDEVPAVEADTSRITQVVAHLVSNAVKYSGTATEVVVQVCRADDAVRLVVVDQGIGMSTDELGQAFSRFFRAPALTDQSIRGVGLGLPIARSIVDRHGGRIWLESRPGAGTTAVVELPLPAVEPARVASAVVRRGPLRPGGS